MTTREEIDAQKAAEWIDGNRMSHIPEDLAVAVYAMRPDWSPKPKSSIEDILRRVESGPFADIIESESSEEADDFVQILFGSMQNPPSPRTTLDDVLQHVGRGPFATDVSKTSENNNTDTLEVANNDRWWSSPILGLGIAVALVFVVLLPSNFESPQQEESIFANKGSPEPSIPTEDVAEVEYLESDKLDSSARLSPTSEKIENNTQSVQRVLEEKSERLIQERPALQSALSTDVEALDDSEATLSDSIPSPPTIRTRGARRKIQNEENFVTESEGSEQGAFLEAEVAEQTSPQIQSIGRSATMVMPSERSDETLKAEPSYDESEDSMNSAASSVFPTMRMDLEKEKLTELSFESGSASPDRQDTALNTETIAESASVQKKRRGRGLLKGKSKSSPSEVLPSSNNMALDSYGAEILPNVLSESEKKEIYGATIESIKSMCNVQNPTKSLAILWVASMDRDLTSSTLLLLESAKYDHGDTRYLKRNWLRLSQLYAQQGRVDQALYYQQMADALP